MNIRIEYEKLDLSVNTNYKFSHIITPFLENSVYKLKFNNTTHAHACIYTATVAFGFCIVDAVHH